MSRRKIMHGKRRRRSPIRHSDISDFYKTMDWRRDRDKSIYDDMSIGDFRKNWAKHERKVTRPGYWKEKNPLILL
tara:strand:+ start:252 stop:476 length:225 start_codon:yes stop_codon:yes gene_type:complete